MAREKRASGLYSIVRGYEKSTRRTIKTDLTLDEARAWCGNKETSSRTCTTAAGHARTKRYGAWFDGYVAQYKTVK